MLTKLNQTAAIYARNGLDHAIKELETLLKINTKEWEQAEYFEEKKAEYKKSIRQLEWLRAELHGRVFDAYKEENLKVINAA